MSAGLSHADLGTTGPHDQHKNKTPGRYQLPRASITRQYGGELTMINGGLYTYSKACKTTGLVKNNG